jgi:hypothetical protein
MKNHTRIPAARPDTCAQSDVELLTEKKTNTEIFVFHSLQKKKERKTLKMNVERKQPNAYMNCFLFKSAETS